VGEDKGQVGASVGTESKDPEQIRREIEDVRHDLGDTAAALAAKTDVKARAKEKVEGVKESIAEKKDSISSGTGGGSGFAGGPDQGSPIDGIKSKAQENPIPTAAIAAFVGGFLLGRLTSR
jgi:ElaB/YqjD/DUF883 family membrane-anchored ribosome-binding protein